MARSLGSQSCVGDFDFSDFAQEFLRRNPAYRLQFAEVARFGSGLMQSPAHRRLAHPWGLEFPCRPVVPGQAGPGNLARRSQSQHRRDGRSEAQRHATC